MLSDLFMPVKRNGIKLLFFTALLLLKQPPATILPGWVLPPVVWVPFFCKKGKMIPPFFITVSIITSTDRRIAGPRKTLLLLRLAWLMPLSKSGSRIVRCIIYDQQKGWHK